MKKMMMKNKLSKLVKKKLNKCAIILVWSSTELFLSKKKKMTKKNKLLVMNNKMEIMKMMKMKDHWHIDSKLNALLMLRLPPRKLKKKSKKIKKKLKNKQEKRKDKKIKKKKDKLKRNNKKIRNKKNLLLTRKRRKLKND